MSRHSWDYGGAEPYAARRRECARCGMAQRTFGVGAGRTWESRMPGEGWGRGSGRSCPGRKRPLVLLDVDGVLNAFTAEDRDGWEEHEVRPAGIPYRVYVDPAIGKALLALAEETGAQLAWATRWEEHASEHIAPLLGLPPLECVPVAPEGEGYFETGWMAGRKADAVVRWAAGRPWAWFDDEPAELERAGHLADGEHLCVPVDDQEGLGEGHVETARRWLAGLEERA